VQPYRRMQVWDAAGGDALAFDADALGQPQLGWIIENNALVDALWRLLPTAGVRLHCPASIEALEQDDTRVRVGLDDGLVLDARLAIAADGGQSALRTLAGIGTTSHDYRQQGVVAFVASEQPHRDTCWQRFLPTGPVALLPFNDDGDAGLRGRLGSIVWTLPDVEARCLRDADPAEFELRIGDRLRWRARRIPPAIRARRVPAATATGGHACRRARLVAGRCGARGASAGRAGREPGPARCRRFARTCACGCTANTVISSRSWYSCLARIVSGFSAVANSSRHSWVSCQRFFIGSLRLKIACRHQPSRNQVAMRSATRRGCSTMSQTIQSSGCAAASEAVGAQVFDQAGVQHVLAQRAVVDAARAGGGGSAPRSSRRARRPGRRRACRAQQALAFARRAGPARLLPASARSARAHRQQRRRGMPSGHGALSRGSPRPAARGRHPANTHAGAAGAGCLPSSAARPCATPGAAHCRNCAPGPPAACRHRNPDAPPTGRRSAMSAGSAASIGVMRSRGSSACRSANRRSFCRAKISATTATRATARRRLRRRTVRSRCCARRAHSRRIRPARRARSVRRRVPVRSPGGNSRAGLHCEGRARVGVGLLCHVGGFLVWSRPPPGLPLHSRGGEELSTAPPSSP
jgi:hypothetical protein